MKKNVTYVSLEKFLAIVTAKNLTALPQAGFIKVVVKKGRTIYIAKTKMVGRVDLSGFEMPEGLPGYKSLGGESFGGVKQQILFEGTKEDEILTAFELALDHAASLEEVTKQVRASSPKVAAASSPNEATASSPEEQEKLEAEKLARRRAMIEAYAAKTGKPISPKAGLDVTPAEAQPAADQA